MSSDMEIVITSKVSSNVFRYPTWIASAEGLSADGKSPQEALNKLLGLLVLKARN